MNSLMPSGPIVIVGAGGLGREVLDIVEAINAAGGHLVFRGFVDDGPVNDELLARRGAVLLGSVSEAVLAGAGFVIGIGSAVHRHSIAALLLSQGSQPLSLIHPTATVGSDTRISPGCIFAAGVRVTTNIDLGEHVHLNLNCTVGHDSVIGDFVSVFPGATVSGNVTIGAGSTIGTGANVLPGVTIGDGSFIGAGAVVTRDVAPGHTVVGSPAKPIRTAG